MDTKTSKRLRTRLNKTEIGDEALLKWEAANWDVIAKKLAEADAAISKGDVRELSLASFLREARRSIRKSKSA